MREPQRGDIIEVVTPDSNGEIMTVPGIVTGVLQGANPDDTYEIMVATFNTPRVDAMVLQLNLAPTFHEGSDRATTLGVQRFAYLREDMHAPASMDELLGAETDHADENAKAKPGSTSSKPKKD